MQVTPRSFDAWLKAVDKVIFSYCGLSHDDLADQTWRDWYDDGITPREAAHLALQDEGFPFDE